jgi:hypothetical protein
MIQYCNNTSIPIGTKVRIIKNFGNECEPFLNLTGTATQPFKIGCCKPNWIGVFLDDSTMYGSKFNFHINEIEVL